MELNCVSNKLNRLIKRLIDFSILLKWGDIEDLDQLPTGLLSPVFLPLTPSTSEILNFGTSGT